MKTYLHSPMDVYNAGVRFGGRFCFRTPFVFWVLIVGFMFWGGEGLVREMSSREPTVNLTVLS